MSDLHADCREFRAQLESALEGRARPEELAPLGWNAHLLACGSCRELLEREEALEELLAGWPDPGLSPQRRAALLACLRAEARNHRSLDHLLESAREVEAPTGLAGRVLAGVADARLDALLDLGLEVDVPPGLAASVLDGLEAERAPAPRFVFDRRWAWPAAAAAAAILMFAWPRGDESPAPVAPDFAETDANGPQEAQPPSASDVDQPEVAATGSAPSTDDDDLLAVLDLLEEDALWAEETLDLELSSSIDVGDEWLLEYAAYEESNGAATDDEGEDS